MARKTRKTDTQESIFLSPDTKETAALYDRFFERIDYTDTCDKCGSEAWDHTISPLKDGIGFLATCNVCEHKMWNS